MKMITPVRRMLDRLQRRFVRSRPGSVLILVVALLVLMALIGTAYMSMAQDDRATSAQHSFNTEVDLLLDGVLNLTKGVVTGDLFVNGKFRPGGTTGTPEYNTPPAAAGAVSYSYWNSLGLDTQTATTLGTNPGNPFLASRTPDLQQPAAIPSNANPPLWRFISAPPTGNSQYDTPYWPGGAAMPVHYNRMVPPGSTPSGLVPGQTAVIVDGQYRPAFLNTSLNNVPNTLPVMAADVDGDGIADAGLFKLLTLDGITYYGAVRIVDNCAAINASIGTRPNPTAAATVSNGTIPGDYSPVNLDLEGMLVNPNVAQPPTDLYRAGAPPNWGGLLGYRYNGQMPSGTPIDENGMPHTGGDFSYAQYPYAGTSLVFDQQWMQLGRRLQNPGNIVQGILYQALPIGESMAMARNFILRDPGVNNPNTSPSILEQTLQNTVYEVAPFTPYQPFDTTNWFKQNFNYINDYATNSNTMPMRALLVSQNPVSNFAPNKFQDKGVYVPTPAYAFGDMVTYNGNRYVCIKPFPSGAPVPPNADPYYTDPNWAFEPWTTNPTKTSINTASFQQLYAAYWEVMCEQANVPPFNTPANARMFRSPIRAQSTPPPPGTPAPMLPLHTLYLRAALAAINTMGLRDSSDPSTASGNDVISRTITIPGTPYQANVYSVKRQPYITEVYARNDMDPANDWMALELYNPYPQPIDLTGWHLATLARGTTPKMLTDVGVIPPIPGQATPVIPANSFLVITSNATLPPYVTMVDPLVSPKFVPMPKLVPQAFGNEVVLMRPRRTSGVALPPSASAYNVYNESMVDDLIPVDSYDLSNLPAMALPAPIGPQEWHYIRPNDPTQGKAWHFVYPGRWAIPAGGPGGPGAAPPPTVEPTLVSPSPLGTTPLPTLGHPQAQPLPHTPPYMDVPIQVDNVDFGGPLKVKNGIVNYFPFGGFARNGDMLQTTFIGSYKIYMSGQPHSIIELNPITMDSAMATCQDGTAPNPFEPLVSGKGNVENIGRFCPLDPTDNFGAGIDDFGTVATSWRYHFATRLFDYLTVQSPQDDYLPNVDPCRSDPGYAPPAPLYRYAAATSNAQIPQPVANVTQGIANAGLPNGFNANGATEETAPVNGLVNINTAPWRTLAAVPWVPATVNNYRQINAVIAQAIVNYRDVTDGSMAGKPHGPFKSIFELNRVPIMAGTLRDQYGNNIAYKLPQYGDVSPLDPTAVGGGDKVVGDFESQFQTITRVSNMITTRSDSYTAYVLIQGWRNAETANPHLVVQRRAAIIIDRSSVTPLIKTPNTTNIPIN